MSDASAVNSTVTEASDENTTTELQSAPAMFKMPMLGLSLLGKKKSIAAAEFTSDDVTISHTSMTKTAPPTTDEVEQSAEDKQQDSSNATCAVTDVERSALISKSDLVPQENAQTTATAAVDYIEPPWGGPCEKVYYFESIKNGTVTDKIDLTVKSYYIFGRLPSCDHSMDHPSLSRYHAIIQHCATATPTRQVGWYLYDLDSTHGTWINKHKVLPRNYSRLRVGYVVKFGGSSRLYILQGPDEDQDIESELSVTEMKQQRERQKNEAAVLRRMDEMESEQLVQQQQSSADSGCSWGIDDDDEVAAEDQDAPNPFALPENEELYVEDPKKALRGFFEREGYDLPEYEFTDEGKGKFRCIVKLPVDTPTGEPLIAEIVDAGKKKDLVVRCALEACRILDRQGLLRKATHESRAKKRKNWEDSNFYDSDEDNYLDRTGELEKKREKRILRVQKTVAKAETYESLVKQLSELSSEREEIERKLEEDRASRVTADEDGGLDALDAFMITMKTGQVLDVKTRTQFKQRLVVLRQQIARLERLVNVAKPASVSLVKPPAAHGEKSGTDEGVKSRAPAVVGRMKCAAIPNRPIASVPHEVFAGAKPASSEFEVEEEEEEECVKPVADVVQSSSAQKSADITTVDKTTVSDVIVNKRSVETPVAAEPAEVVKNASKSKSMKRGGSSDVNKKGAEFRTAESTGPQKTESYDASDDKYSTWLPPSEQLGDGLTKLNAKFGY